MSVIDEFLLSIFVDSEEKPQILKRVGGMTNDNFLVQAGKDRYVLRISGAGTEKMVNRLAEKRCTGYAVSCGWHPELLFFGDDGTKVTRYIDGETLTVERAQTPEMVKRVAQLLNGVHASSGEVEQFGRFDFETEYARYASQVDWQGQVAQRYATYIPHLMVLPSVLDHRRALSETVCFCHNDLVPENLVWDVHRLYLLDWEYAGMNDPAWDLASYMSECNLSTDMRRLLLETYLEGSVSDEWQERILINEYLQHILWFAWTIVKEQNGVCFGDYGEMRITKAITLYKDGQDGYHW